METDQQIRNDLVPLPKHTLLADLLGESESMLLESETLGYPHREGAGSFREKIFRDFLIRRLPGSVACAKGHVQDSSWQTTSEFDILLYDPIAKMLINSAGEDRLTLPVECVIAAIEVRTRIDSKAIRDASAKSRELARLTRRFRGTSHFALAYPDHYHSDPLSVPARSGSEAFCESDPSTWWGGIPVFLAGLQSVKLKTARKAYDEVSQDIDGVLCVGQYYLDGRGALSSEDGLTGHAALPVFLINLISYLTTARRDAAFLEPIFLDYFRVPE